ncbi:Cd(II)/Pb(II)-responsive transcriptional regulator [Variovorax gossypii]
MLQIGQLSKKADCLAQTVRFYEAEGLIPEPARSQGNFRLYDDAHLQRLLFIRRCRAMDLTLDEIRQLLSFRDGPELDCSEMNGLVDSHIAQVSAKIKELRELERELMDLRRSCDTASTARECGILNTLA